MSKKQKIVLDQPSTYPINQIQKIEMIIDAINNDEKLDTIKVRKIYKKDWRHADDVMSITLNPEFTKEKKYSMLTNIQDLLNTASYS